jgi:predicted phosphodiesterase
VGVGILALRMRIAVLSDIHANLPALEAVQADLPDVDQVWVLGDIVGYGPQPNQVIETLQAMGARSVLGNHDGAAIGTVDAAYFNPDARSAIEWTAREIDDNSRSYIASLPEVRRDGDLTAVHGSPRDPIWEYITSRAIAAANFDAFDTRLCLFGHTHVPVAFRQVDGAIEAQPGLPGDVVQLNGGRALLNPGSVGQPRDGLRDAAYAILELSNGAATDTISFRRVPYEIDRTQRLMREATLPARLVERLSYGR